MNAAADLLPVQAAPESEQSGVRKRDAVPFPSWASPAQRHGRLSLKLIAASATQRRLPAENREGQLLAIAILRRDEALLDEVLRRLAEKGPLSLGL